MLWNLAEAVKHGISGRSWVRNGSICLNPYFWSNYTNKEPFEAKWGPLPWKLWNRFSDQHKSFFQKGRRNPKFRLSNNIIRSHFEKSRKVLHNLKAESSREFWWKRHPIWWTLDAIQFGGHLNWDVKKRLLRDRFFLAELISRNLSKNTPESS